MKTTLFVLITIFGFALPADALDLKAITSKPTADNPQFDNKEAWPDLVGDESFLKQKWDKAERLPPPGLETRTQRDPFLQGDFARPHYPQWTK